LRDVGCKADIILSEAETFIYASRSDGPAQARIFRIKEAVPLAALPATCTRYVLEAIRPAYPQFIDGVNVQYRFEYAGAIFHPALTCSTGGLGTHGDFQFYIDGVTLPWRGSSSGPGAVTRLLLGIRARTAMIALKWLIIRGEDRREAIQNQPGIMVSGPSNNPSLYIEDVPMSLVPIALGQHYGFGRGMDSIIRLACIVHRTDYWRRGARSINSDLRLRSVSDAR
jgi:opine dehydrogenase